MDIEYDPLEEEADEVGGVLDYDGGADCWVLICSEHEQIARSADGSAAGHDSMIRRWTAHLQSDHHGDGAMSADDGSMLIEPINEL